MNRPYDSALDPFIDALAQLLVADHRRREACVERVKSPPPCGTPVAPAQRGYARLKTLEKPSRVVK